MTNIANGTRTTWSFEDGAHDSAVIMRVWEGERRVVNLIQCGEQLLIEVPNGSIRTLSPDAAGALRCALTRYAATGKIWGNVIPTDFILRLREERDQELRAEGREQG